MNSVWTDRAITALVGFAGGVIGILVVLVLSLLCGFVGWVNPNTEESFIQCVAYGAAGWAVVLSGVIGTALAIFKLPNGPV